MAQMAHGAVNQPKLDAEDELVILDQARWSSLWDTVMRLNHTLDSREIPALPVAVADRRDELATRVLDIDLDADEAWLVFRMKRWVRDLEAQVRDLLP